MFKLYLRSHNNKPKPDDLGSISGLMTWTDMLIWGIFIHLLWSETKAMLF